MSGKAQVELIKANVLTHLKTAWEQLGAAQQLLHPKTELWNQIHRFDSDIEDMMDELKEGGYDNDSLSQSPNTSKRIWWGS